MHDAPQVEPPVVLDARGERCPLPVIRLARLAAELADGSLVWLLATDPAAQSDVPAFCRMRGHELVEIREVREVSRVSDVAGGAAGASAAGGDHTAYLVRVSATPAAGGR